MEHGELSRRRFIVGAGATLAATALTLKGASALDLAPPDKQPVNLKEIPAPSKKLGWAIVGLGQLALDEIMPAFAVCRYSRPAALVSGHRDKADKVARLYGIDNRQIYNYHNFDSLKDDPNVEIVYIVLPNSMHAEYTIRALKAGKHVLCEKPMAQTAAECREMIKAADQANRKLMIAYRLRYEPFNQKMIELAQTKRFGEIRMISADNIQNVRAPNIRLSAALGGGPLGDVGVYCINASRYLTNEDPVEVTGMLHQPKSDPRFAEVPDRVVFTLRFPSGVLAHCSAGFSAQDSRRYQVFCENGWYGLDPAYSYRGLQARVSHEGILETLQLPIVNHFAAEMDHLSECVTANKPVTTPGIDGLKDVQIITSVMKAAEEGRSVKLELG